MSTDEVFGSLGKEDFFRKTHMTRITILSEQASSDHLVSAWFHTYELPIIRTNCSNNFGPYQFPEKLIPIVILKALDGIDILFMVKAIISEIGYL